MMIIEKKELCINKQNKNITSFKRFDGERRAHPSRSSKIFSNAQNFASKNAQPVEKFFSNKKLISSNCDYSF